MTGRAEISVTEEGGDSFRVEVGVGVGQRSTTHVVRVTPQMVASLGWSGSVTDLLSESFAFLLEREPQTSILRTFDLDVISSYFPEYPADIARRDGGRQSS